MWVVHKGRKSCGGTFGEMKCRKVKDGCQWEARWMKQGKGRTNMIF